MSNLMDTIILDLTAAGKPAWEAIDDRIMGGSSQSSPEYIKGVGLRFSGQVSLENDGGFASIRSEEAAYDLSTASSLKLRVHGDGKTYKVSLRTDVFFDGVSYQAEFKTEAGIWQEIELPFKSFLPTHHGLQLTTVAPMDTAKVKSFGIFIAGKQEGPFQLDIAWIKAI